MAKRSMAIMDGNPAGSLRVEPRLGGQIVEVGQDDVEYLWGTITALHPSDSVGVDFHMGLPADNASCVEVRFVALTDEQTRVVLTQSNWEAFGDLAEMMRGGYGSGWVVIFEQAYKAACAG